MSQLVTVVILPFSSADFLQVFAAYNAAIWPMQFVAAGLGVLAVMLLVRRSKWADRAIAAVLFTFWLAMAIGYHWTYFSTVNDAAEQLRPRLGHAIGASGFPQLLMRFGFAEAVKQSVRRPVEDVLI